MISTAKYIISTCLTIALSAYAVRGMAQSTFKLAAILQDNMVLQQGKPLRVWGTAKPGDVIKINADWTDRVSTAHADDQGNWIGEIKVPKTTPGNFTPHVMVIIDGNDNIKLSNLLIGDVWLCAGQSNMDMPVERMDMMTYHGVLDVDKEIAAANYPNLRICRVRSNLQVSPAATFKGQWQLCSPKTVGEFSGVAYFFGRELYNKLNIPIGLVLAAAPGASTQAFVKREVLASDTLLNRVYLQPYVKLLTSQAKLDSNGFFPSVTKPTVMYNGFIAPIINLSIKGVAWYQGESNEDDKRSTYISLFKTFLADLRHEFNQGDLPFYYTQVAPFREGADTTVYNKAIYRETQEQLLKRTKKTAIAITMDVGEERSVHPRDKKSVGDRLAFIALNKTYHLDVPYLGPHVSSFKVDGNVVTVYFKRDGIGSGLKTKDGQAPRHFFVAGHDHIFHYADAKIVDNTVILHCDAVANPVAVRYAFTDAPITNFENKGGLPALPFRTDAW